MSLSEWAWHTEHKNFCITFSAYKHSHHALLQLLSVSERQEEATVPHQVVHIYCHQETPHFHAIIEGGASFLPREMGNWGGYKRFEIRSAEGGPLYGVLEASSPGKCSILRSLKWDFRHSGSKSVRMLPLRLVIYEFFSSSSSIPRGFSAYKPSKLVVYCLNVCMYNKQVSKDDAISDSSSPIIVLLNKLISNTFKIRFATTKYVSTTDLASQKSGINIHFY